MKTKTIEAARLLYNEFRAYSDCFDADGNIIKAENIAVIGSDPSSAIWGAWLYLQMRKVHNFCPNVICYDTKNLRDTLIKLSVSPLNLILISENRIEAVEYVCSLDETIIWPVPQRASLYLKDAVESNSRLFVIEQSFDEVLFAKYNKQSLCNAMLLINTIARTVADYITSAHSNTSNMAYDAIEPKAVLTTLDQTRLFFAKIFSAKKRKISLYQERANFCIKFVEEGLLRDGDMLFGRPFEDYIYASDFIIDNKYSWVFTKLQ